MIDVRPVTVNIGAEVSGVDLTDLTDADFDEATLRRAVVDDCSLAGARFVRADLRDADLRGPVTTSSIRARRGSRGCAWT